MRELSVGTILDAAPVDFSVWVLFEQASQGLDVGFPVLGDKNVDPDDALLSAEALNVPGVALRVRVLRAGSSWSPPPRRQPAFLFRLYLVEARRHLITTIRRLLLGGISTCPLQPADGG